MSLEAALGNLRDLPKKEYEAMCHCTAIKYTVKIPELEPPTSHPVLLCNCSICVKAGYLLIYPLKEDVIFTQGKEHLKEYKAYDGHAPHYFCDLCGSSLYIDHPDNAHPSGNNVYCVSVRMFRGLDLDKLVYVKFDGKGENQPEWNEKYF